jgi:hypothetical protein
MASPVEYPPPHPPPRSAAAASSPDQVPRRPPLSAWVRVVAVLSIVLGLAAVVASLFGWACAWAIDDYDYESDLLFPVMVFSAGGVFFALLAIPFTVVAVAFGRRVWTLGLVAVNLMPLVGLVVFVQTTEPLWAYRYWYR